MQVAMLMTRVGDVACAFPIDQVVEIMRPLPIQPIGRSLAPGLSAIGGMAMVRGEPVPVIDARRLFGISAGPATRFVVVRVADRRLAVAVDDVLEVRPIDSATLGQLPPLLRSAERAWVSAVGARDAALLTVLDAARVLRDDAWQALVDAVAPVEVSDAGAPGPVRSLSE